MCMITYVPANIDIPWEGIENGALFNDDGHGWAIASEQYGLEVGKSMEYDMAALTLAIAREKHGPNSIVMFHSRWATHGETSAYNVHPFRVDSEESESEGTVMAHNGILAYRYHPLKGDARSDTRIFGDEVAKHYLGERGVPSRRHGRYLGNLIGGGNKLVFLTAKGGQPKVRIVNAHLGVFTEGVWYSNDGYRTYHHYRSTNTKWDSKWDDDGLAYGNYSSKSNVIGGSKDGAITSEELDCGYCGGEGTIDLAAGVCKTCEICLDCKEYLGVGCMCHIPEAQREDLDASTRELELWTPSAQSLWASESPLNPTYNPEFSGAYDLG